MNKKQFAEALKKAKEGSKKRNFSQKVDLIFNLTGIDLKKPEQQVEFFTKLPHSKGRVSKICALADSDMAAKAKEACDSVISADDFGKYASDKKASKKLSKEYDFFIAQASIMPKVAASFGRVFGPRGKMPNPKAGCVFNEKTDLKSLCEGLRNTIKISAKTSPMIQCSIGSEDMNENDVAENAFIIYEQVTHHLPNEKHNVKSLFIKLTMGKPVKVL